MPTIAEKLKGVKRAKPVKSAPSWKGPCDPGPQGGITQSMIGRFLSCRERFRIRTIEELAPVEQFNHRIEYGQMWHVCEEAVADHQDWRAALTEYVVKIAKRYPGARSEIDKWANVCRVQFPIYLDHWKDSPDERNRRTVLAEEVFHVPYNLPSGRTVYLRGKWDSVDIIKDAKGKTGVYITDNKTKGDIDVSQIQRQLTFDLQMMFYSVAYLESGIDPGAPFRGIRYNVVRRPLSGGRGSIVQRKGSKNVKPETDAEYYERLGEIIRTATGEEWGVRNGENYFFSRWTADVTKTDLERFRERCLDPILEQIACWYESVTEVHPAMTACPAWAQNWVHPFGVTNNIDEYGSSDLDAYITTGSTVGLVKTPLFRELQEDKTDAGSK